LRTGAAPPCPKCSSDAELDAFLKAFDCADPVGLRDYAIARCLLDLGLRGHEVTYLTLESVDWRSATLTISSTKSKRVQQLPLPVIDRRSHRSVPTAWHDRRP
jgi:integrase/recombinase XerD